MADHAPGKHFRKGVTLVEVLRAFPDDAHAEQWFIETRWPDGIGCPCCGSLNVREIPNRKPMPYRCRDCRQHFSVKNWDSHAGIESRTPDLGVSVLPPGNGHQGYV